MVTVRGGKVAKIMSPAASRMAAGTAKTIQYQYLSRQYPPVGLVHLPVAALDLPELRNADQFAKLLCEKSAANRTIGPKGTLTMGAVKC
jgi:hypothetical protein